MPIIETPGAPRLFRFERCPLDAASVACVTTRDVTPHPHASAWPAQELLDALGLDGSALAWADQVHGARILACTSPGPQGQGDAMVTDREGLVLTVRTADCLPVFVVDAGRRVVGIAHAGWRGASAGVAGATVGAMASLYGCEPPRLWAGLGPAIGPCCYEIGEDVATNFAAANLTRRGERWLLDLPEAVATDLTEAGVPPQAIERTGLCTACRPDVFHSYRRDQSGSRLFSLVGLGSASTLR